MPKTFVTLCCGQMGTKAMVPGLTKNNNWELVEYIYFNGAKYISYNLNKIKKNKNVSIEVEYPKYCYILNQKNLYKKMIMLFKEFDFYDNLNINNFKVFLEDLFNNEEENQYILSKLKVCDINQLKKLLQKIKRMSYEL